MATAKALRFYISMLERCFKTTDTVHVNGFRATRTSHLSIFEIPVHRMHEDQILCWPRNMKWVCSDFHIRLTEISKIAHIQLNNSKNEAQTTQSNNETISGYPINF